MLTTRMNSNIPIYNLVNEDGTPNNELSEENLVDFGLLPSTKEATVRDFNSNRRYYITDDPIQRTNKAWDDKQATILTLSMIEQVSMGPIRVQKVYWPSWKKFKYNILDGVQRFTNALRIYKNELVFANLDNYVEDEENPGKSKRDAKGNPIIIKGAFVLVNDQIEENGDIIEKPYYVNIAGLTYKSLPQAFRYAIDTYKFDVEEYEFNDNEIKKTLFFRWNNGTALNDAELRKVLMDDELIETQNRLKNLPVIQAGLNAKSIDRNASSTSALSIMMIIKTDNNTALGNKKIDMGIHQMEFTVEEQQALYTVAEFLNDVYLTFTADKQKEYFTKNKMISMVYVLYKQYVNGQLPDMEEFKEWISSFYYEGGQFTSTAQTTGIKVVRERNTAALESYQNHFKIQFA